VPYRVKNWRQFQHYKDRNPPWIKLHFALLASEDWVSLDDASRVLAIACMLIASRNGGVIPENPAYIKRVAYLNKVPNFKPLIECGFLEPASKEEQEQAEFRPEERREETEKTGKTSVPPSGSFLRFWATWPPHERKESQGRCWEVWQKSDFDQDAEKILAHVEVLKSSERWRGGFVVAPLVYLNQRRWEGAGETQPSIKVDV
jgi:hypothetical protein